MLVWEETSIYFATELSLRENSYVKVAEHSFQEPIPNSPLLLSYLSFGARFLSQG